MKSGERWLYLPIEVKVREQDAKLILAYHALKEGYHVMIGDHIQVEMALESFPKGIFFSKGGPHGFRKRVITHAKDHGHLVVELDEEGLLIQKKSYLMDRMRRDTLLHVSKEFCWGSHQKRSITSANPDLTNRCHEVGNPRFDLLQPKYRTIYEEEAQSIKDQYGNFILVNTRFSQYNTAKGKKENTYYQFIKQLYNRFLDLVEELCKKFPQYTIVIRPHPGEDFNSYRKYFSGYKNVHVVHEGSIIKWLMAAQVIIHNGCTSGIEAFLLNKPLISFIPFATKELDLPNQLGRKAKSYKEVISILENIFSSQSILTSEEKEQQRRLLSNFYKWDDNSYSYTSILQYCRDLQLPSHVTPKNSKRLSLNRKHKKRKFTLTEEEISDFFSKLDQIEGNSTSYQIVPIAANLYKLSLK